MFLLIYLTYSLFFILIEFFRACVSQGLWLLYMRQHCYFRKMLGVNGCQNRMEFRESLLGVSGVVDFTPVGFRNSKIECLFVSERHISPR